MNIKEFKSRNLYFKLITEKDSDIIVKWRSDYNNIKYLKNNKPLTLESHNKWFHEVYLQSEKMQYYIIYVSETGKKIGTVSAIFEGNGLDKCYIGYGIFEKHEQGKGYGKESVIALIDMITTNYQSKTFIAEIHKSNAASIKLISNCGFVLQSEENDFLSYILNKAI